ncbi:MAG: methionyl-tRNA formyltransferase [Bacteroidota bacterium]
MKPRIVFMGTPEFAVPSLEALIEQDYPVVGVVTTTDKMGGRGGKRLLESAVKKCAQKHNIPILQPTKLRDESFLSDLRRWNADLQIVVAFRMLPEVVWSMPKLGTFNLHGSLLPKYRGAAPINWAIIKGEEKTGLTTFFIRHQIDTGDMLLQAETPIGPNETAGDLHDRMMGKGADLVVETVQLIESGDYKLKKQDDTLATPAPKLNRANCQINWNQPAQEVHDFIRGLSPYPAAWTVSTRGSLPAGRTQAGLNNENKSDNLKIFESHPIIEDHDHPPGTLLTNNKDYIKVACLDGFIDIKRLQVEGRKRMAVKDLLNGYDFEEIKFD